VLPAVEIDGDGFGVGFGDWGNEIAALQMCLDSAIGQVDVSPCFGVPAAAPAATSLNSKRREKRRYECVLVAVEQADR